MKTSKRYASLGVEQVAVGVRTILRPIPQVILPTDKERAEKKAERKRAFLARKATKK